MMDLIELRWSALQCHLLACAASDPLTVSHLNEAGRRFSEEADRLSAVPDDQSGGAI